MSISIIAAVAKNGVIGNKNDLPWKLSEDMKYFAQKTTGKSVLMGKNTYLSILNKIGKPLPNRKNYVLSRTEKTLAGVEVVDNLQKFTEKHKDEEVFIIGGASIYELALPFVDKMYITEVECDCTGDAYFPKFNLENWKLVEEKKYKRDEKNEYDFSFKVYKRKQ